MKHLEPPKDMKGDDVLLWYERALARDYFVYVFMFGSLALASVLLIPVLIKYLSVKEFAVFGLIESTIIVGMTVSMAGLKHTYMQWAADHEMSERGRMMGTILSMIIVFGIVVGSIVGSIFEFAVLPAMNSSDIGVDAWILASIMIMQNVNMMFMSDLRSLRLVKWVTIGNVSRVIGTLFFSYIFLAHYNMGVRGVFMGQLIAVSISSIIMWAVIRQHMKLSIDFSLCRPFLVYGVPLMVSLVVRYGMEMTARFLVAFTVSVEATAAYVLAFKVASLFESVTTHPFWMAWSGMIYRAIDRSDIRHVVNHWGSLAVGVALTLALWMSAGSNMLFEFLSHGKNFHESQIIFPLILLGYISIMMQTPLTVGLLSTRKMVWMTRYSIISFVGFLVLVPLGIWFMGLYGIVLSWMLSECLGTFLMARNSHRIIPISYSRKVAASVVLVSGGLFLTPFIIKSIGVLPVYQIGVLGLLSVLMIYITLSNRASASIEDKS